jgi:hypothetical protein
MRRQARSARSRPRRLGLSAWSRAAWKKSAGVREPTNAGVQGRTGTRNRLGWLIQVIDQLANHLG